MSALSPSSHTPAEIRRRLTQLLTRPPLEPAIPNWLFVGGFLVWFTTLVLASNLLPPHSSVPELVFAAYPSVCAAWILRRHARKSLRAIRARRNSSAIADWLERADDVGAVPLCLEAVFEVEDSGIRKAAADALARLLPKITAEHDFLFTPESRHCLRLVLQLTQHASPHRDLRNRPDLIRAALHAMRTLRDIESISVIEYVMKGLPGSPPEYAGLTAAANTTLSELRHELALQSRFGALLRPADKPFSASETLLRPAMGTVDVVEEQLLRPADPPDP